MIEQHHLNEKVKLFTGAILSTAKETMPRGRTRDYIPDWNAQLQELHSTASRLREKMESCPRDDNIAAYNKAKAEFTKQKLQQTHALCVCVCVCVCVRVCECVPILAYYQPCKPSCLVNLTQCKRNSQRTSAPSLRLPVLFFSEYQHTPALGEMK